MAKIRLYYRPAKKPIPKSPNQDFGHVFVEVEVDGKVHTFDYYPDGSGGSIVNPNVDDARRNAHWKQEIDVSDLQGASMADEIDRWAALPPPYDPLSSNCTNRSADLLKFAGVDLGHPYAPADLWKSFNKLAARSVKRKRRLPGKKVGICIVGAMAIIGVGLFGLAKYKAWKDADTCYTNGALLGVVWNDQSIENKDRDPCSGMFPFSRSQCLAQWGKWEANFNKFFENGSQPESWFIDYPVCGDDSIASPHMPKE